MCLENISTKEWIMLRLTCKFFMRRMHDTIPAWLKSPTHRSRHFVTHSGGSNWCEVVAYFVDFSGQ